MIEPHRAPTDPPTGGAPMLDGEVDGVVKRWLCMIGCLGASVAAAGSAAKAGDRRVEAQSLVGQIMRGQNVPQAVNRLTFLGEQAFATRELSGALHRASDPKERGGIAQALSTLGDAGAEPALVTLLRDDDGALRMLAAQGLGRLRPQNLAPLKEALSDKTLGVRREAARALGLCNNPKAARALLEAARVEGVPEVRAVMLVAVGRAGDRAQSRVLEPYLTHSSATTRDAAAQALCLLGSPRGYAYVEKRLGSADRFERRAAVALLEGTRAREAQKLLRPRLQDGDPAVAAAAARVLYQGGDDSMLGWLVEHAFQAQGDAALAYENELEPLRLTDEQRQGLLRKAGLK